MAETLLAPNATPWMRALEATSAPAWPLPVGLIADFDDPWACPAHLLDDLAFETSVDLWDETWSEAKKRSVIARSPQLHRLKGTLAGLRAYVGIAGGEIRRVTAPPQGVAAGGQDEAERQAWLARFPEFRLYTHTPRETDFSDAYPGEACAGGAGDDGFAPPDAPDTRFQRRAGILIKDGVEIPVARHESSILVDGVEQLVETYVPGEIDTASAYAGQACTGDALLPTDALPALTLSLGLAPGAPLDRRGVVFRGPFIDSAPERVRQTAVDPAGACPGVDYMGQAVVERGLDPAVLCFDRWRLADPRRSAGAVAPGDAFFGDQTFLGQTPFTLLLDIKLDETAPPMTAHAGGFMGDCLEPHDSRRTDLVLEAIRSAAADRDQVLVRFARHRPQRLADRPTLPLRLGQLVADF